MKKKLVNLLTALVLTFCGSLQGYAQREQILLDEDWLFAFGNAASPEMPLHRKKTSDAVRNISTI